MLRSHFLNHIAQTNPEPHIFEVSRGEGIYLYDVDDRPFIDLISGISVSSFGHSHPLIIEAIKNQADQYLHTMVYGEHIQAPQVKLARKLSKLLPDPLDNVYYVSSGSECVEAAIKIAKKYTGRRDLVACKNAYHGSSHGPLSLMDNEYFSAAYRPLLPNVRFFELNNEASLSVITESTAAVFLETIQGEAGIRIPTRSFMQALRARCTETGAILVLDEIQAGMGRTGKLWAFQHFDVAPDVILLSKAFGGGMPLGAIITSKKIMHVISDHPILGHITTFGGHPVCCAAGLAALNMLTSTDLISSIKRKAQLFIDLLNHPQVKEIRSIGFLMALDLQDEKKVKQLMEYGMAHQLLFDWFLYDAGSVRIAPPLIITEDQIRTACKILVEGMDQLN